MADLNTLTFRWLNGQYKVGGFETSGFGNPPLIMTTDAVIQLIQAIENGLAQSGGPGQLNTTGLSQADSILGTAANYAQILGTAEGPIAQAAAIAVVGGSTVAAGASTTGELAGAAGQAEFLSASATTSGVGAVIVLIVAFVLAAIAVSEGSQSTDSQEYTELANALAIAGARVNPKTPGLFWEAP